MSGGIHSQSSMNLSHLSRLNYGRNLRDRVAEEEDSDSSGGDSGMTLIGLLEHQNVRQSMNAFENYYVGTLLGELLGVRNIEKASLLAMFAFLESVMAAINLGNIVAAFSLKNIPTGLFYKAPGGGRAE
jgi:putative IMPACT (imprinted ancient) family translation regulator